MRLPLHFYSIKNIDVNSVNFDFHLVDFFVFYKVIFTKIFKLAKIAI